MGVITFSFISGIIEGRIQNYLSNKQLDHKTKSHIVKELQHLEKELTHNDGKAVKYRVDVIRQGTHKNNGILGYPRDRFHGVSDVKVENGFLTITMDDEEVSINLINIREYIICSDDGSKDYKLANLEEVIE